MLVWGLMLLRSKLFYCLQLPIQSNARGGDQNGSVGINAASQQILLLSPLPIQSNARGRASQGRIVRRLYSFNSSFDIRRGSINETNILNLVNSGVFHHHLGA